MIVWSCQRHKQGIAYGVLIFQVVPPLPRGAEVKKPFRARYDSGEKFARAVEAKVQTEPEERSAIERVINLVNL